MLDLAASAARRSRSATWAVRASSRSCSARSSSATRARNARTCDGSKPRNELPNSAPATRSGLSGDTATGGRTSTIGPIVRPTRNGIAHTRRPGAERAAAVSVSGGLHGHRAGGLAVVGGEDRQRRVQIVHRHDLHLALRPGRALAISSGVCESGTRNSLTPAWRTASTLCSRPPIGPTVPSGEIVPVAATSWPPVSSPGVSSSMRPSVKASPAEGPPTWPLSIVTAWG